MKSNLLRIIALFILLGILTLSNCRKVETQTNLLSLAQMKKNDLRLSTYVTAHQIQTYLADPDGIREAVSVLESFGITKVILEVYRGGLVVAPPLLRLVRDQFISNGFEVWGGIATVPGEDFGVKQAGQLGWFNWQAEKTQKDLETVMRQSAPLFDVFIVDDFLCTADTSNLSKKSKGSRNWSEYRRDLLVDLSKRLFIDIPKEAHPSIKMIIKYPQWYDRFHLFGYDVSRQPKLFDSVWIGTETRGPDTQRMGFVKQYQGYVSYQWMNHLSGEKLAGAWFDHIDCDADDFIDQAYESVLAGAKDIVLFNFGNLIQGHPGHHHLRLHLSRLISLAKAVAQNSARGIYGYKPPNSDAGGDLYIFDYLGMMGIPVIPTSDFPEHAKVVFLPTQAASDVHIVSKLTKMVENGRTVILSSGFLKRIALNDYVREITGIKKIQDLDPFVSSHLVVNEETILFAQGLNLETLFMIDPIKPLLYCNWQNQMVPYLVTKKHRSGGMVCVLNSHTFSEEDFLAVGEVLLPPQDLSILNLPVEWINDIRHTFLDPLNIAYEAPARVALHLLGESQFVFANFNNEEVTFPLSLNRNTKIKLKSVFDNKELESHDNVFQVKIPKREILWIRIF